MDPITILVTAASATRAVYQVSTTLYCFIQGSLTADKSLQSFVSELDSLKNSIVAIEACLRSPSFQVPPEAGEDGTPEELFSSLDTSLKNCQATLEQFEAVLINLSGNPSERNPFRKPIMKIKLDLNAKDMVLYRAQIGTHSSAMQMALQTINM
jgi:hypothetical protein